MDTRRPFGDHSLLVSPNSLVNRESRELLTMVPPSSFPLQVRCLSLSRQRSSQRFLARSFFARWNSLSSIISGVTRRVGVRAAVGKQLEDALQDLLCSLSCCAHEWQLVSFLFSFHNSTFQLFCKITL